MTNTFLQYDQQNYTISIIRVSLNQFLDKTFLFLLLMLVKVNLG